MPMSTSRRSPPSSPTGRAFRSAAWSPTKSRPSSSCRRFSIAGSSASRTACAMIAKRIETNRAKLDNPNKPIGVFMLCGPSGVGKTETALALAEALYGGEQNMITINMSEFQEAHTVSTLKGAPPGYVGYGEGGRLTEAVRRRPYSVILLDEVEKAHPDVHEIFFQVFDKGVMEDGTGRRIDFKNTLIILTSNVGTDVIMEAANGPLAQDPEALAVALRPDLAQRVSARLARPHRHHPVFSAFAGNAGRHRAAAIGPHRQADRGEPRREVRLRPGASSITSSRSATIRIPAAASSTTSSPTRSCRRSRARSSNVARARGDQRGESRRGGRRLRLRSDVTFAHAGQLGAEGEMIAADFEGGHHAQSLRTGR